MKYIINHKSKNLKGSIKIPPSKSISNRALILRSLNQRIIIKSLSESKDTMIFQKALNQIKKGKKKIFIGNCGTAMRFLTSYASTKKQETIIYGSKRAHKRPISDLVTCLKLMGAKISYLGEKGFLPISVKGGKLKGGKVEIDGSKSSQMISALILIASEYKKPIEIIIKNNIVSKDYITTSLKMMSYFGIKNNFKKNVIYVDNGKLENKTLTIEGDWSCAAYWYNMASCSDKCDIKLYNLNPKSTQPDRILTKIYKSINVDTYIKKDYIQIIKNKAKTKKINHNLINSPDIVPSLITTCVINKIKFKISGISHLKYKESNRIEAMKKEIRKTGSVIKNIDKNYILEFTNLSFEKLIFQSYWDHRITMSLTVFGLKNKIKIINPDVVKKSYPNFWDEIKKIGFEITKCP